MDPEHAETRGMDVAADVSERAAAHRRPIWPWALAAGLLAGLASWACGEATYGHFRPAFLEPPGWGKLNVYERADYRGADEIRQKPSVGIKNVGVTFGALGALLGGLLGLAGGLAVGSPRGGLTAGIVGALAGLVAAAGASAGVVPPFYRFVDPEAGLVVPLLTHLALFAAVGAAGGLALGLGVGRRGGALRGLLAGLCGGMLGAAAYEVVVAVVFPQMRVFDPLPSERLPRLIMHLGAALFASALAAFGVRGPGAK